MIENVKVSGIASRWSEDQVTGQLGYSLSRTEHEVGGEVADLKSSLTRVTNGDARAME